MTHIQEVADILAQLSTYTIIQSKIEDDHTGVYISPSPEFTTEDGVEVEYFDIVVIEDTLILLQTKKTKLLKIKTNKDFDFNDFDARGYITVSDGTDFAVDDAIVGTTSAATGTVYRIDGNTLYLKTITGTWQVEAINGKTATCTATQTLISFPFYIENTLVNYKYDLDANEHIGGLFTFWIRFEARWAL